MKEWKKIYHITTSQKTASISILFSSEINLKATKITKDIGHL